MSLASDNEEYKAKITSCFLYVPVGIMSAQMTTELYNKWNNQSIKYHYQRMVIQGITMPTQKQEFFSDSLFPESENPSRVYVMLVNSKALLGNYSTNPFQFRRKWDVTTSVSQTPMPNLGAEHQQYFNILTAQMQRMQEMLKDIANKTSNEDDENTSLASKRPRKNARQKAKTSQPRATPSTEAVAEGDSFLSRMWTRTAAGPSQPSTSQQERPSSPTLSSASSFEILSMPTDGALSVTKSYWVTKLELELNSSPLDQLESRGTADEAMADYLRLSKAISQWQSPFGCSLSYQDFLNNCYICAFDLTTSQAPGTAYVIPSVRTGMKYFMCQKII
jgi:hypothetical protein